MRKLFKYLRSTTFDRAIFHLRNFVLKFLVTKQPLQISVMDLAEEEHKPELCECFFFFILFKYGVLIDFNCV